MTRGKGADALEPGVAILGVIVDAQIVFEQRAHEVRRCRIEAFVGKAVDAAEGGGQEDAVGGEIVAPLRQVLARVAVVHAFELERGERAGVFDIQDRGELGVVPRGPVADLAQPFRGFEPGDVGARDRAQLDGIEHRARDAHRLQPDRGGARLREVDVGEIAVGEAAQVDAHGFGRHALAHVEIDAGLGIAAFGQLALARAIELHQRGDVREIGGREAERGKELMVQRERWHPLLAAGHQRHAHQMVVDDMREMIGRQAGVVGAALEDHRIVAVVELFDGAANAIRVRDATRLAIGRAVAHDEGRAGAQPLQPLIVG